MSYATRRSTGGFGQQQGTNNVGGIGQRRPGNFVPGGQLNTHQKPGGGQQGPSPQQQQQMRPPHANVPFRAQQGGPQAQNQQQQQQQTANRQAQQQQTPVRTAQPEIQTPPQQQPQPQADGNVKEETAAANSDGNFPPMAGAEVIETGEAGNATGKKKAFWIKRGKITRKEQMRRRNVRLSKILQPKNAVMILNELVRTSNYTVEELPVKTEGNQFKATVTADTQEHVGFGRSKIQAKNSAAEAALKHFVKTNKMSEVKKDEEGNEKMDVSEDDSAQAPQPWQHLASFALFKLFSLWGEDPNSLRPVSFVDHQIQNAYNLNNSGERSENKPAKKMPANPETINPLMLINQMLPQAKFEEIGKSGDPPNVTFSFRCSVEDQSFIGTGPNKKAAKRMAAFGACHKILGVNYPTDIYVPIY